MKKINLVIPIHMPDFVYNGLRSIKRRYRTPSTDADAQKPPDSAINIDQLNAIPVTDKWANPLSTLRGKMG